MAKNSLFSIPKLQQMPIPQGLLIWIICRPLKNEDAKTSPFPKLPLEKELWIVYNHHRSNQRILTCPMIVTGNLIKFQLRCRLLPIAVGGSQFTFYGDCRGMIRLQKQPIIALKFLTYSYVLLSVSGKYNHHTIPTLF